MSIEKMLSLLVAGNIVVVDGFRKTQIVLRLTDDLLQRTLFGECVKRGYYKIREATLLEKEYWFCGYNQSDTFALLLSGMFEWEKTK